MPPHADVVEEVPADIRPDVIDLSTTAPMIISSPRPCDATSTANNTASGQWTPKTVLAGIPTPSQPVTGSSSPIAFFHILSRLKTTKREGWRRFGISHGESISDHMYRMSIMTMLCPVGLRERLDLTKCTKMALVHDMAELLVGDITPVDGVSKSEKSRREEATIDYLCDELLQNVDAGIHAAEIKQLWHEYEKSESPESIFVHDVDKMELILQMVDYERDGKGTLDLGEFAWVARRIEGKELKEWCREVLEERNAFWKNVGIQPSGAENLSLIREKQQEEYYSKGKTL